MICTEVGKVDRKKEKRNITFSLSLVFQKGTTTPKPQDDNEAKS